MQFIIINAVDCLVIFLFLYLLVIFRGQRRRRGLPYLPGPPSRPIIGNLLDIPRDACWTAYADMSKKYGACNILRHIGSHQLNTLQGDVICLCVFSRVVVVLCSLSAVKDLLEKRGETYSDRPSFPVLEMYVLWHSYFPIGCQVDNPRRTETDWPLFMTRMSETWRRDESY
jgi:hypothetical protein